MTHYFLSPRHSLQATVFGHSQATLSHWRHANYRASYSRLQSNATTQWSPYHWLLSTWRNEKFPRWSSKQVSCDYSLSSGVCWVGYCWWALSLQRSDSSWESWILLCPQRRRVRWFSIASALWLSRQQNGRLSESLISFSIDSKYMLQSFLDFNIKHWSRSYWVGELWMFGNKQTHWRSFTLCWEAKLVRFAAHQLWHLSREHGHLPSNCSRVLFETKEWERQWEGPRTYSVGAGSFVAFGWNWTNLHIDDEHEMVASQKRSFRDLRKSTGTGTATETTSRADNKQIQLHNYRQCLHSSDCANCW